MWTADDISDTWFFKSNSLGAVSSDPETQNDDKALLPTHPVNKA